MSEGTYLENFNYICVVAEMHRTYFAQSLSNHHLDIERATEYTLSFTPSVDLNHECIRFVVNQRAYDEGLRFLYIES